MSRPLPASRASTRLVEAADDDQGPAPVWHTQAADDVLVRLQTGPQGLSPEEAGRRLEQYGPNTLERERSEGVLTLLWRQISNPLIFVLLGAAALALGMGKVVDGLVVLGVVVLNTLIGFIQEHRAGRAIAALSSMVPEQATVMRAGQRVQLAAEQLVPGDLVLLESGDKVPADLRLLTVRGLRVEEASLTGESVPVEKGLDPLPPETSLGDRTNLAFSGTLVAHGVASGLVVATAERTELGRINTLLGQTRQLETPLTRQLAVVGRWLTYAIGAVAVLLLGLGLLRGYSLVDAVLAGITLAVAAIPEGLPAIVTIALAIGVQRMARRQAVIRSLPAVETLGSTTVICSDKTGTLTRNEMTVRALWTSSGRFDVTGVGYAPLGVLTRDGAPLDSLPDELGELLLAGAVCNDARVAEDEQHGWRLHGDPTEGALVVVARKLGQDPDASRASWERLDALPFESERRFMATLHRDPAGGGRRIFLKGAPEVVLPRCATGPGGTPLDRPGVSEATETMARQGMRILAVASRAAEGLDTLDEDQVQGGFVLLGLAGMIDPPRAEVIPAIEACRQAGISVKMITGDHRTTAQAIGQQLGLCGDGPAEALTGTELARLGGKDELRQRAREVNVFARVAPEHKLDLVRALQADGQVVAMTGDGVNDAPALRQSNVGVAMGLTGTAASREAADIVLANDDFASIAAAVEEGRRVYDNLVKALAFVLPTNIGEALIVLVAVAFFPLSAAGQPLMPIEPVQILWVNLVATVSLALPLAFEAMEPDIMRRPPRPVDAPLFSRFVLGRTVMVALLIAAAAIGLFWLDLRDGLARGLAPQVALREAQTLAVTTVVLFQIFYLLNCRSLLNSVFAIGLFSNRSVYLGIGALLVLQLAFVYAPPLQTLFRSAPLSAWSWVEATVVAAIIVPVISVEKWFRQRAAAGGSAPATHRR